MTDTIAPTPNNALNQNVLAFTAGSKAAATNAMPRDDAKSTNGMPAGYATDENGIYELRDNKEGDALSTRICSPLIVKGRCRNTVGHGWGRVLTVQDPDGMWHELVLSEQQLNKSANVALAPLFNVGFELAPVEKAAKSVMKLLNIWRPEDQYLRFDRLGWTDNKHDAFVLGCGHVIGNALVATDLPLFSGPLVSRACSPFVCHHSAARAMGAGAEPSGSSSGCAHCVLSKGLAAANSSGV
ncbi:protein of unknown function [Salinihabitans flavidus]|uniref:DUF927 domain-containing protein n=1 Tax=Salinihabitans flavidus TaxID=569882 RepID=A0A1H8WAY3_9RHOB|nr:protein of unknown function [Salinihabitans flavidus]